VIVDLAHVMGAQALHGVAATRRIEAAAAASLPEHALMQRAGEAVARVAMALAPAARSAWVLSGPGNNGGDGYEAALWLHRTGWQVHVTELGAPEARPADARAARARALSAGVSVGTGAPAFVARIAIDALLGIGASRAPGSEYLHAIAQFNAFAGPRLAVDVPSGLDADRGVLCGESAVRATDTVSLLTLKPGLLTGRGRDHAGRLWLDELGAASARHAEPADAWTVSREDAQSARGLRPHSSHKGSYGDVLAIGGAPGMTGAMALAARAALASGAGRVYACALDPSASAADLAWPELMQRSLAWAATTCAADHTLVAGCGGGDRIGEALPWILSRAGRLVLDADALNAIAADTALQTQLIGRAGRELQTVLTPHPLEAARLLGQESAAAVQADRLASARTLARRFGCTVLLKGSGTVIAAPDRDPVINTTGNARLSTAGSGDVLAGWIAGLWSSMGADNPAATGFDAARAAAFEHGLAADDGSPARRPLTASALLDRLTKR
jgi:ADP-dependent NAD(P)H-hydrate dehydratase / NAD(P)H-hydrate epimerase